LGVPERTLGDWYYNFLQRRPNPGGQPLQMVRRLGIDELALKKTRIANLTEPGVACV
jgi:hypothetical protein